MRADAQPPAPSDAARGVVDLIRRAEEACAAGRTGEARDELERTLRRLPAGTRCGDVSTLHRLVARTYLFEGEVDVAVDCLGAARACAESCGDAAALGLAINEQGNLAMRVGSLDDAVELYTAARDAARVAGDRRVLALTDANLGVIATIRGDLDTALRHHERSLAQLRTLGQARQVARALNNLGLLYTDLRRWEEAERAFGEAVHVTSVLGDLVTKAMVHVNVAELWIERGAPARARGDCDAAMGLARQLHNPTIEAEAHKLYGMIARETGDFDAAERHFGESEAIAVAAQEVLLLAEVARERADLHRRQGRNRDLLQALNRAHRLFTQLRARRDLADVDGRIGGLEAEFLQVARKWGDSIEAKDRYTQGHCERVADLACAIAEKAGLAGQALFWFRIGALLHDVGKLLVPEEVLNKPGKLTPEEWALVRSHPAAGVEMLADVEFPWDVQPIVLSHHERWDGKGYPQGLAGEEIPLTARILCVADVYDALTSVRSYKRALTHDEAMGLLRKDVGTMFDPQVFAWFEEVAPEWEARTAAEQAAGARALARAEPSRPVPAAPGHDPLTGLPSAATLHLEVDRLLGTRGREPLSLVVVRVAEDAPDAALLRVAEAICRNTSGGSAVARLDRAEFAVLLPDVTLGEARVLAERLHGAAVEALAARGASVSRGAVRTGVATAGGVPRAAAELVGAASADSAAPAREAAVA